MNGKGVLDERHPSALGASVRLAAAHDLANRADVLLLVGTEVGDADLWGGVLAPGSAGSRTVVRVDLDPSQMHKNVRADIPVVGDAATVLADVLWRLAETGTVAFPDAGTGAARSAIEAEAAGAPARGRRSSGPWRPRCRPTRSSPGTAPR